MIGLSTYLNARQLARFKARLSEELGELDTGDAVAFICRPDHGGIGGGACLANIEDRARVRACGKEFDRVCERFEL